MRQRDRIKLVAVVGAGGNIGPYGAPIQFDDAETRNLLSEWVMEEIKGTSVIIGSTTWWIMRSLGFSGYAPGVNFTMWSRSLGLSPDQFLEELSQNGKPIVILGGAKTYEIFGPYADTFILRRARLVSRPDHKLPSFFEGRSLQ